MRNRNLWESFKNAFRGATDAIRQGRNIKIELAATLLVIAAALLLRLAAWETVTVLLLSALVIAVELLNSALENLVDLASPGWNDKARQAKDMAAAAVLLLSIFAAAVGLIIFLPKIIALF